MRTIEAVTSDLVGMIMLGNKLRCQIPRRLLKDPSGRERRRWKEWSRRLNERLHQRAITNRQVPSCHVLGVDPEGYDWAGGECKQCSAKITCISASEEPFKLSVPPAVSAEAVETIASTMLGRARKPRRLPPVVGAKKAPSLWSMFPSGLPIPRVFPGRPMGSEDPTLYRVILLNLAGSAILYIDGAWNARKAAILFGTGFLYDDLCAHLESKWSAWKTIEDGLEMKESSTALWSSGAAAHVHEHIQRDRKADAKKSHSSSLRFFHMSARDLEGSGKREYHAEGRKIRSRGTLNVWQKKTPRQCHRCSQRRDRSFNSTSPLAGRIT